MLGFATLRFDFVTSLRLEDEGRRGVGNLALLGDEDEANATVDTSAESKKKSEQALKELGGEEAFYGKQGKGE